MKRLGGLPGVSGFRTQGKRFKASVFALENNGYIDLREWFFQNRLKQIKINIAINTHTQQ